MEQKIVHKQYNSPIDLYSMNNIRKTIEAHTELIAPGVKGINFMKAETPINKQSEVYKLVMEEEHKSASPSATAGPTHGHQASASSRQVSFDDRTMSRSMASSANQQQQANVTSTSGAGDQPNLPPPSCHQCGHVIVGHYAKVQDKSLHPHCFNCSTCGTSLKNTGYFTINDKLYCEIHAKQMASVMRIRYDFDAPARQQQQQQTQQTQSTSQWQQQHLGHQVTSTTASSSIQVAKEHQQHQTASHLQQQQQQQQQHTQHQTLRAQTINELNGYNATGTQGRAHTIAGPPPSTAGSQATISTMFADRSRMTGDGSSVSSGSRISTHNESYELRQQQQQSSLSHLSSTMESRASHQHQQQQHDHQLSGSRVPICIHCQVPVHGPYVLANKTTWCKPCSQTNFVCCSCRRSLLDIGFIEDGPSRYYCECCYEAYFAPTCAKCNLRIKGDCLNALGKKWHPSCFVCGHCQRPFGNSSFYLEDQVPYCERDWNILFTTKCYACSQPIEAGDKWVEALARNYHSTCFKCTSCQLNLEGSTFYCKQGRPYCRLHAR